MGILFESRKGFFFWTGHVYSPKSVVDAMLKELIYTQERILWIAVWNNVWQNMKRIKFYEEQFWTQKDIKTNPNFDAYLLYSYIQNEKENASDKKKSR